ncbi:2,3-diaminopropionate biosynthesis protein SbnA [Nostoc sp. 'Peltigera membranacea cyanobiont' 213]|uniref:2,3-diaminopropionate biosynthesis protein SbnA n=1 Tax=Nostoc sp. 'Peltigera membranacea cyanobiont' 213 TaxID=2014530 RepID=UPI000B9511BF|nr:2,3-diaminopropionate biosynthesis protein SbnA [Nostoc sp. 'Peltigera membranacea cyanobiont' 213]OYD87118.1 2,3-diaminopropionate biosynthesis protein SbnA [Nostoc sp. 'Peltigera membranacea cyanobiont' 213]
MVVAQQKYLANLNTLSKNNGILTTIGNTPLIKLEQVSKYDHFQLFGKLEMFNPGGSIKDRPAFNMLKKAFELGKINPETTIIESSSGNLGIGLAQICALLNLRFICVVDLRTTQQNINILKVYGAEIVLVAQPDPITNDFLQARINQVKSLLDSIPNSFWCNQYANLNNPYAHYQTMHEIVTALDGQLDYLFCATSTCGTLRGCSEYVKSKNLNTKIIAVDVEGSVIFEGKRGKRLIPGAGAARVPELFQHGLEDEYLHVSDLDCVVGCRTLLRREAILAGGSSGGMISAIEKKGGEIPDGANCVAILCDRGERYLDTIYSNNWVEEHFGNVFHLW